MSEYIPSTKDWVREQVAQYEASGGTEATTLRDTGLPVIIVTNRGNRTGAIRKTPLMRAKDGDNYILVASVGGSPKNPVWVYNLRADPQCSDSGRGEGLPDAGPGGGGRRRAGAVVEAGCRSVPALRHYCRGRRRVRFQFFLAEPA